MSTQHQAKSTEYTIQTINGVEYRVYEDGRKVKNPGQRITTVGRGNAGTPEQGKGKAGANIFKAQAIEHIVNQRGMGGGSNPNGWDEGDIGLWGRTNGVTVEDLQNLTNTQFMNNTEVVSQYNTALIDAGVLNADGSQRTVQWGDSTSSLDQILAQANKRNNEIDTAEQKSTDIENDLASTNTAGEQDNVNYEREQVDKQEQRDFETASQGAQFDFELAKADLDNEAKEKQYKMELERYDRRERRDSIAALIAGLATLGSGFAI